MSTTSTTSNFSSAHIDAYIRKKILSLGKQNFVWRKFVNKESLPAGNGTVWKALRYQRLDVPLSSLTEGTAPSETDLAIDYLTSTAVQYGIVIKITDVLQLTIENPVLQKAVELKAEVIAALDDKIIAEAALGGTNVFYGGSATARSGMTAGGGDVLTTTLIRKAIASLRATDGVKGRAPSNPGASNGAYACLLSEKAVFDVQADTDWKNMAYRLDKEDLEKGMINRWAGAEFYSSPNLPVFRNPANGMASLTLADATAVTDARLLNGLKCTSTLNAAGSLAINTNYYVVVTARHKKRSFEENISSILTVATNNTANHKELDFVMPSDTNYVYSLYFGASNSRTAIYKHASGNNVAAGGAVNVTATPSSALANPPVAAPRHTTSTTSEAADVFPTWILGGDCIAVIDLENLVSTVVNTPDSANPLNQFTLVGSKFMEGTAILQDSFMARIEAQSGLGA